MLAAIALLHTQFSSKTCPSHGTGARKARKTRKLFLKLSLKSVMLCIHSCSIGVYVRGKSLSLSLSLSHVCSFIYVRKDLQTNILQQSHLGGTLMGEESYMTETKKDSISRLVNTEDIENRKDHY
jgi:hypothetical protein